MRVWWAWLQTSSAANGWMYVGQPQLLISCRFLIHRSLLAELGVDEQGSSRCHLIGHWDLIVCAAALRENHLTLQHFLRSKIVTLTSYRSSVALRLTWSWQASSPWSSLSWHLAQQPTPPQLKGQFSDEPPQYFKSGDILLDEEEFRVLANASPHILG